MNLKKNKPFLLRSKTQEAHDRRLRGTLHLWMLLFALALPFFVSGVLGYIYNYIQNDIDFYPLELFLYYFIPLLTVAAQYLSYGVMAVSLCFFSVRASRRLIIDYVCGAAVAYLIIPCVLFVLTTGQELFDTDNGLRTVFYAMLTTVFTLILSFVLLRGAKRTADRFYTSGGAAGKTPIFSRQNVIFKITSSVFGMLLIINLLLEFLQYTLPFLLSGEMSMLNGFSVAEGYAILIVQSVIGAVVMLLFGTYLHRKELRLRAS